MPSDTVRAPFIQSNGDTPALTPLLSSQLDVQSMPGIPSHTVQAPPIESNSDTPALAPLPSPQQLPLEPHGSVTVGLSNSRSSRSGTIPPTVANPTVQESAQDQESTGSRGRKRKGDEAVAKPPKKLCSKGMENTVMPEVPSESVTGKELGEGTGKSDEVNERAGKPTFSGRVPLLPTHLAQGGYQGQKKGVRVRNANATKKPKSKGKSNKPASKGVAKIPAKQKVKQINPNQATGDK
jgi:hypothetical protein